MPSSNPIHQPKMSASQRRAMDQQARFDEKIQTIMQGAAIYQRIIWMIAQERGGTLEIDTSKISPLWALKCETPDPANPNHLKFTAETDPDLTDEQIQQIAKELLGTSNHPKEALARAGCPHISHTYLISRMSPHIIPIGGKWVDTAAFEALAPEVKQRLAATPPVHG